jgi:hypothetical protein
MDAALAATEGEAELESVVSLALAESLGTPLVTKNRDLSSRRVPVLYC